MAFAGRLFRTGRMVLSQRLDFALTFETYPQVALRNTACPLAALMRSVFRRILANLRSCQSGTNFVGWLAAPVSASGKCANRIPY